MENQAKYISGPSEKHPLIIKSLLLEHKKAIETFNSANPYDSKVAGDFHFFTHGLISLIEDYPKFKGNDKNVAMQFVIDGINLLKEKSSDFATYARKNVVQDPLLKPRSVEGDYFSLYARAALAGIIQDKSDIQNHFEQASNDAEYSWASLTLGDVLKRNSE